MDEELGDHSKALVNVKNTLNTINSCNQKHDDIFFSLYCCRPDKYPVNRKHNDFQ